MTLLRLLLMLATVSGAAVAWAADDLDTLLQEVRQAQSATQALSREREQRFLAERDRQRQRVGEAKAALAREETRSAELHRQLDANAAALAKARSALQAQAGDLAELTGVVRQSAGALRAELHDSLISGQLPGREAGLLSLGQDDTLPTVKDIERLWLALQEEMTQSAKVASFRAPVVAPDGTRGQALVTRVGPFDATSGERFLRYLPESEAYAELARQPAGRYRSLAWALQHAATGPLPMAVDPTRGAVLGLYLKMPDALERLRQGGLVGYVILALGAIGMALAAQRLGYLGVVGVRMRRQLARPQEPRLDNPLGRVLVAADARQNTPVELIEGRLDEAILRETPPLEWGRGALKLLAAVAPMLGLLGTVTGMIATFQAISLYGTGDPKLMASGISQALVTTLLGLTVAIPLLFLHSVVVARSRTLVQVLEEQGASAIARSLEQDSR